MTRRTASLPAVALLGSAACGWMNSSTTATRPAAASPPVAAAPAPNPAMSAAPVAATSPAVAPPTPAARLAAPVDAPPAPAATPTAPPKAPEPVTGNSKDRIKTRDRYINVKAKCEAAEDTFSSLKRDSASLGHAPHPDIAAAFHRMRAALQTAGRELDSGEIENARESLDLAEASAAKVLRAGGGN